MEDDLKQNNGRRTQKKMEDDLKKKLKMISKKTKTKNNFFFKLERQSTKINPIGCDTIVNSPSYNLLS
jgi:hypothetical protein